jgi:hypothetical protein
MFIMFSSYKTTVFQGQILVQAYPGAPGYAAAVAPGPKLTLAGLNRRYQQHKTMVVLLVIYTRILL